MAPALSVIPGPPPAAIAPNAILARLLERLYASLVGGASLNCRPHRSRQRVDLFSFNALGDSDNGDDGPAGDIVPVLLGPAGKIEVLARVPAPRGTNAATAGGDRLPSREERAAQRAFERQDQLLAKLRDIAGDARDYEQDHGESALYVGYPLLHLPPGAEGPGGGGGGGSRRPAGGPRAPRVLAPVALIPVELAVRRGPGTPSVTLKARGGGGADLVLPNPALLAWIEQQGGRDAADLFADETGADPWREIAEIVRFVAGSLRLEAPAVPLGPDTPLVAAPRAGGESRGEEPATDAGEEEAAGEPTTVPAAPAVVAVPTGPGFVAGAVLGLFPVTNQGLLRDLKAMVAGQVSLAGTPVQGFLSLDLDAAPGPAPAADAEPALPVRRVISPRQQRLVSEADPCQTRAVRLARQAPLLVVHGPPGTGKSQTITNVVGDHLARGERVLLVCDKRTALDVVRYRLDALGLGGLCAVVHDPQRDGRALYKKLREQLESLADGSRAPAGDAAADLDALDADLERLHGELTACHHALQEPTAGGGRSFHELVGEWLALPGDGDAAAPATTPAVGELTLGELQTGHADLLEILERARRVRYAENLWVEAAGVSLPDFLARPAAVWREALARLTAAAMKVDAETPGGADLPALEPDAVAPLPAQADAREALAGRLETLAARPDLLPGVGIGRWAGQPAGAVSAARTGFDGVATARATFDAGPLDPALLATVGGVGSAAGRTLPDVLRDRGSLRAYDAAAASFFGRLFGRGKAPAQAVAAGFGLSINPETSARLGTFLEGIAGRLILADFTRRTLGVTSPLPDVGLPADADLRGALDGHRALLDFLGVLHGEPILAGLVPRVQAALAGGEPVTWRTLADALRRSARRARALAAFAVIARDAGLFSMNWLAGQDAGWRAGEGLGATFESLESLLPTLESLLRLGQTFARLPANLQHVAGPLRWSAGNVEPAAVLLGLRRAVLGRDLGRRLASEPALQDVDGERVDGLFARYAELAARKRAAVRDLALARWGRRQRERLLSATGTQLNATGAALKRRLVTRGERAMKLRQVLAQGAATAGGDPLFDLCPVWMASPATVAQIFPREAIFDCVVFDEASQCRLEEALPVLLRAKRVVVAGDPKQLPPTRFFESGLAESEAAEAETDQELFEQQQGETEDLLAAALNLQVEQAYLDVHYRSRHEALIGFSNENFYDRRLQAIPGHPKNRARECPVRLVRVDGVYEKRTNRKEAEAVVEFVKELLARPEPPSVGVACFNLTQRQLILDLLDEAAMHDREFADRLAQARARRGAGSFEGLFVKNLENVQGDERDHILVSTTFGPDEKGRFRRNFGPVGRAGGGRRLNVLVTRARDMVHVFTSIPRGEYAALAEVPVGETPGGRWLLYAYLRYAETLAERFAAEQARRATAADDAPRPEGEVRVRPSATGSTLAQALAARLARGQGLSSDVHWGNEGFGIDVALRHPFEDGMVTAGLLCDLTRFDLAEDPVEWELFRLAVHRSQGWRLQRVWSPALFRDPEGVQASVAALAARVVDEGLSRPPTYPAASPGPATG